MKKETIGIIILAIVFCFGIGAMLKGRDWDYDREEVKAQFQKDSVAKLSPYAIDSVTYDSNTHVFSVHYVNGNLEWFDVIHQNQIDWNWFKKGYKPEQSGVVVDVKAYDAIYYYGDGTFEEPTIKRLSFRDTINKFKMITEIKRGDVVCRKTRDTRMTVAEVTDDKVRCIWFDRIGQLRDFYIKKSKLVKQK